METIRNDFLVEIKSIVDLWFLVKYVYGDIKFHKSVRQMKIFQFFLLLNLVNVAVETFGLIIINKEQLFYETPLRGL